MVKLSESIICGRTKISSVENVRRLNCWGCDLDDVSIVERMQNIEVLSLSVNKITTLKHFASCKRLRELYMRSNCIKDLNEVAFLQNLNDLRILWLDENPCANEADYRNIVLRILPSLTMLDNRPVSPSELSSLNGQSFNKGGVMAQSKLDGTMSPGHRNDVTARFSPNPTNNLSFNSDNGCETASVASSEYHRSYHENNNSYDENYSEFAQTASNGDHLPLKSPQRCVYRRNMPQRKSNDNILQAVLTLLDELDDPSLRVVMRETERRIHDSY